jgi:hypothetical protein
VAGRALRAVLTILVYVLIVVLVLLSLREIVVFSRRIASQSWAQAIDMVAGYLVLPFGQPNVNTPYHGVFDVDNALTILVVVLAEWGLSAVRDRA